MGNTLGSMQKTLADNETKDARELLDRLEDMAEDRIELFYDKIGHDEVDKHIIPIKKVLNKYTYIGIKYDANNGWLDDVKDGIQGFSTGAVAEGLSAVATDTIGKMFNSVAGRRHITQRYAISLDALGGVSRLDYFIFTYTFTSTDLVNKSASLLACCVVESSADISNLDENTIRVIVSRAFKDGVAHSLLTAICSQLIAAVIPTRKLSPLSAQQEEELQTWYRPVPKQTGFQPQASGGLITYPQNGDGASPASGEFSQGGFSQGGFQPVEVAA